MDASTFQSARDSQLKSFQSQYAALKSQYTLSVNQALAEKDSSLRSKLVSQVLGINKQITALINAFTGTADIGACKSDPNLKNTLSSDLDKYSADYENIQQGTSQLTGLKDAIKNANDKADETKSWFSWYNGFILFAVIILIYIIMTRAHSSSTLYTQPGVSVFSGSQ